MFAGLGLAAAAATVVVAQLAIGASPSNQLLPRRIATGYLKRCPVPVDSGAFGPEGLLRAIRENVPRAWHIENQSGRVKLTPKNYGVLEIVALVPNRPELPSAATFRRLAERRCGLNVAERSWVVLLDFYEAGSVHSGRGIGFFVRTRTGWLLWYRYR